LTIECKDAFGTMIFKTVSITDNNISFKKAITLTNLPVHYPVYNYEKSIEKVVEALSGKEGVLAIYQIGGVNSPGISDIDLVVVFHDKISSFEYSYRSIFDKNDSYLFMHSLFGMPAFVFKDSEILPPMYNLKKLYGEDIPVERKISAEEKTELSRFYAVEFMISSLFNLVSQYCQKNLKVRNLLCSMKALTYDLEILYGANLNAEMTDFRDKILRLRQNWWNDETNREDNFREVCELAIRVISQGIRDFNSFFSKDLSLPAEDLFFRVGPNRYIISGEKTEDTGPRLVIKEMIIMNLLNRLSNFFQDSIIKKQISDLKAAFHAIYFWGPSSLLSTLSVNTQKEVGGLLGKRNLLMKDYQEFMSNIHPSYGIFDILGWHISGNIKWKFIRSVNDFFFSKR